MNYVKNALVSLVALSAMNFLVACGDDSSSPSAPAVSAVSSSSMVDGSQVVITSSDAVVDPGVVDPSVPVSSSSTVDPLETVIPSELSSSATASTDAATYPDEVLYTIDASLAVTADEDGFYDIADIYKAAPQTSKIVFVIRHSARDTSSGQLSPLTTKGAAYAKALGERMGGTESFYYASTDFVRTRETAANIAVGRGDTPVVDTLDIIDGNYFYRADAAMPIDSLKKKSTDLNTLISRYCYNYTFPNATTNELVYASFYPLIPRGNQFVKEVILNNMANWKRVSILVSHDVLAEPMVVYASNRAINLKAYSKDDGYRWVNFMSGVAIIVNEAGAVSIYPVRGYDVGWQNASDAKAEALTDTAAEAIIK